MGLRAVLGPGLAAWLLVVPLAVAATGPQPQDSPDPSDCLWAVRLGPVAGNILFPDEDATYYFAAVPAIPGLQVAIHGAFPHARYMSFVSYDGQPIDALLDADIPAQPGQTNPFVPGASRDGLHRNYTVEIVAAPPPDPGQRAPGTLYVGTGQLGVASPVVYVMYRIYVPDAGTNLAGGVPLPRIAVAGSPPLDFAPVDCETLRNTVPDGREAQASYSNATGVTLPPAPPQTPTWHAEAGLTSALLRETPLDDVVAGGPGSNPHTRYLATPLSSAYGDVVALRARAPTTPPTREGQAIMQEGDLRYWSFCLNSRTTSYLNCISDSDVLVDADGTFTLVWSSPAHRPPSAKNWIPFGPEPLARLLYRHMLPSEAFRPQAAQGWVEGGPPLEETMGPYYPRTVYCSTAEFEATRCGLGFPIDPVTLEATGIEVVAPSPEVEVGEVAPPAGMPSATAKRTPAPATFLAVAAALLGRSSRLRVARNPE